MLGCVPLCWDAPALAVCVCVCVHLCSGGGACALGYVWFVRHLPCLVWRRSLVCRWWPAVGGVGVASALAVGGGAFDAWAPINLASARFVGRLSCRRRRRVRRRRGVRFGLRVVGASRVAGAGAPVAMSRRRSRPQEGGSSRQAFGSSWRGVLAGTMRGALCSSPQVHCLPTAGCATLSLRSASGCHRHGIRQST